jgi:arginyl-tRNA synthetase
MNLRRLLEERLTQALAAAGAPDCPAMVSPAARPEFGDYQANGVMPAAKKGKTNPRKLAERLAVQAAAGGACDLSELTEKFEVAGPGFINIRLRQDWLGNRLSALAGDHRLGVDVPDKPQTAVVDYSAPNLAKEMHVGHLRSTIIGDALARTLEFIGHKVIRQNHVGDWGTQFGMLIARMKSVRADSSEAELHDLEEFYRQAKHQFDSDPAFADAARAEVVALQSGDPQTALAWRTFLETSLRHCEGVYRRLDVGLIREHLRGESAYNDDLGNVVADLQEAGLLTESRGAQCVFLDEFKGKDGEPLPLIVRKSDEGFLYATTDLAAIRYRVGTLHADRILYVVDARQSLHFKQLFAVARKAGFARPDVSLEHEAFGTMMGADGRPFKTRTGDTVKLMDLLDEAERRAYDLVTQKNAEEVAKGRAAALSEEQRKSIAKAVGIGAVKYADLCQNRTSDYVFSWDKMLSLDGNTAPYMQYAYARIQSIFRKARQGVGQGEIVISQAPERALALRLLQFPETVETVAAECLPNVLCAYLYDLAGAFMGFYENCPVIQSEEPIRGSRLRLCDLTARAIKTGLELLGISTIEQM